MDVTLSAEHRRWLTQQVANGTFATIEEGVASAIEQLRTAVELDVDWAQPLVAAADASLARGDGIEGERFLERLERRLGELKRQ